MQSTTKTPSSGSSAPARSAPEIMFRSAVRELLRDTCAHKDCFLAEAWFPTKQGAETHPGVPLTPTPGSSSSPRQQQQQQQQELGTPTTRHNVKFSFDMLHCKKPLVITTTAANGSPASTPVTAAVAQRCVFVCGCVDGCVCLCLCLCLCACACVPVPLCVAHRVVWWLDRYAAQHHLSQRLCYAAMEGRRMQWCVTLQHANDKLLAILRVPLKSALAFPVVRRATLHAVIVLYSHTLTKPQPAAQRGSVSALLLRKVLALSPTLDWVHEHMQAPPPRLTASTEPTTDAHTTVETRGEAGHRMVCYDSHTLRHAGKSLQASVKICLRTVCSTLNLDGAEAWFALPADDRADFAYSYLVVSQTFQARNGDRIAYPPDRDSTRHRLSMSMCEAVAHGKDQVWWDETILQSLSVTAVVPVKTVIGVPVLLEPEAAEAQIGGARHRTMQSPSRHVPQPKPLVVSVMIFFSSDVIKVGTRAPGCVWLCVCVAVAMRVGLCVCGCVD